MAAALEFYVALGFRPVFGGADEPFSTVASGECFVNLIAADDGAEAAGRQSWGRVVFHVDDVDDLHRRALAAGLTPSAPPCDAPWGERMFAVCDPMGNDLSFARRLPPPGRPPAAA
ncbi:MAG TPA: glyoxalase [Acidimicrobiaceae bacterium]|nr:glyoxalase [Acidimicrobiaceae bacterium]HCB36997.1 glyoxalase [Acidimicrobiaceae bacterium]